MTSASGLVRARHQHQDERQQRHGQELDPDPVRDEPAPAEHERERQEIDGKRRDPEQRDRRDVGGQVRRHAEHQAGRHRGEDDPSGAPREGDGPDSLVGPGIAGGAAVASRSAPSRGGPAFATGRRRRPWRAGRRPRRPRPRGGSARRAGAGARRSPGRPGARGDFRRCWPRRGRTDRGRPGAPWRRTRPGGPGWWRTPRRRGARPRRRGARRATTRDSCHRAGPSPPAARSGGPRAAGAATAR